MEGIWLTHIIAPIAVVLLTTLVIGTVKSLIGFTKALASITGVLEYIRENLERHHERITFLERRGGRRKEDLNE